MNNTELERWEAGWYCSPTVRELNYLSRLHIQRGFGKTNYNFSFCNYFRSKNLRKHVKNKNNIWGWKECRESMIPSQQRDYISVLLSAVDVICIADDMPSRIWLMKLNHDLIRQKTLVNSKVHNFCPFKLMRSEVLIVSDTLHHMGLWG